MTGPAARTQLAFWWAARLLRSCYDVRVRRPTNLLATRAGTRLIFASTHQSVLDPWLLMNAFDHREWRALAPVRVLATQTFADGFLARIRPLLLVIYRLTGAIVLPPRGSGPAALAPKVEGLVDALARGQAVAIFPEGHVRTRTGPPVREFAPGVVYVHRRSDAPIVPIAVWTGRRRRLRKHYEIRIGRPLRIPPELGLHAGADWLRGRIVELYREAERDAGG